MSLDIDPYWDDSDWEICNDKGFIYKRQRRLAVPEGPSPAEIEADLSRQKRACKRRCLRAIRVKYQREMEQWEALDASLIGLSSPLTSTSEAGESALASPPLSPLAMPVIDDLLIQVETQEAVLGKLSDLCDCLDSFCEAQEKRLTCSLIDLPVFGSPRTLMRSLCSSE